MKALILGGTGAMGGYLVSLLQADDRYKQIDVTSRSPHYNYEKVSFILGNARDSEFLRSVLSNEYDVVVDFMNWGYDEFCEEHKYLLASTNHYVFLSSSRVYANSNAKITEDTPRLLDVSDDKEFLSTQRYALRKARQENMLRDSGKTNYTIIRPYITYSDARLQLGVYEKEQWLYRALLGKPIVLKSSILDRKTSLTYGKDVSYAISRIMLNDKAYGEAIQIASSEETTWRNVLNIYLDVIENQKQMRPSVYLYENDSFVDEQFEGGYQTKYDREWDRSFDSKKINEIIGTDIIYRSIYQMLPKCIENFITHKGSFLNLNEDLEKYFDELLLKPEGLSKIII